MDETKEIVIDLKDAFTKRYRIRLAGTGRTIETSLPRLAVEREAKRLGLNVDEFLESHQIEWIFNSFQGLHARFIPLDKLSKVEDNQ